MPLTSDPAPCEEGEQLFECPECGERVCSGHGSHVCECGAEMQNLSVPRGE